jgi:hypothetical protein
VNAAA